MLKTDLEVSKSKKCVAPKDRKTIFLKKSVQNKQFTILSGFKIGEDLIHFLILYNIRC